MSISFAVALYTARNDSFYLSSSHIMFVGFFHRTRIAYTLKSIWRIWWFHRQFWFSPEPPNFDFFFFQITSFNFSSFHVDGVFTSIYISFTLCFSVVVPLFLSDWCFLPQRWQENLHTALSNTISSRWRLCKWFCLQSIRVFITILCHNIYNSIKHFLHWILKAGFLFDLSQSPIAKW